MTVLLYAAVLSLTTGLLCGCVPAFRTYRLKLSEALREGQKGTGSSRGQKHIVQNLTVVVEVSMALVPPDQRTAHGFKPPDAFSR